MHLFIWSHKNLNCGYGQQRLLYEEQQNSLKRHDKMPSTSGTYFTLDAHLKPTLTNTAIPN